MATATSRESRRRKIVERGADRLALITGRIDTLPSESSHKPGNDHDSSQPLVFNGSPPQPFDPATVVSSVDEKGGVGSSLPTPDLATDDANDGGSSVDTPPLLERGTEIEASRPPVSDLASNVQSSSISSVDQTSTVPNSGPEQLRDQQMRQDGFFTSKEISSAIAATEKWRLLSTVTIAFLIVFSHLGFPLLGGNTVKNFMSLRPLYLVLLTNLTLVLVRLLFSSQRGFQRVSRPEYQHPSTGRYDWATQASKALEVGLVMQKAADAIFMDCSIYAIILICGLTLV